MNWKPIETAPKDRRILLWFSAHEAAVFGQWDDEKYVRTPKPHFAAPELARLFGKVWMRVTQPTHWAEAPEPPAQPRRPYGTDTMSEYGVIPECDGSEPPAQQPTENLPPYSAWLHVIDEAMVVRHLGVADPDDDYITAKRKLHAMFDWEIDVATDPAVGGDRVRKQQQPVELVGYLYTWKLSGAVTFRACGEGMSDSSGYKVEPLYRHPPAQQPMTIRQFRVAIQPLLSKLCIGNELPLDDDWHACIRNIERHYGIGKGEPK